MRDLTSQFITILWYNRGSIHIEFEVRAKRYEATRFRMAHRRMVVIVVGMVVLLGAAPPPPEARARVRELLAAEEAQIPWPIHALAVEGGEVTVCLEVSAATLRADAGMGAERVEAAVARALTPLEWTVLHVRAWDATQGRCRALSDFLPAMAPASPADVWSQPLPPAPARPTDFPQGLAGKTVYISAGHGWWWNSWAWRTQRIVYQGFIEDHNNAEAVGQFLIPYLEQAGATVIPVRERDWNTDRVIVEDDADGWEIADAPGYAGGIARTTRTVTGAATMTATWTLTVPQARRLRALRLGASQRRSRARRALPRASRGRRR